ncbi:FmdB family zinc ribbon protein [Geobacter sp. SVR]|uniref:FmdB family zinc ribbon protein n=1 Tax=Geobacter sp. SVR TaxID=2495594 RepID=UPI001566CB3F|nr:FmdB family zinc ribbon protein [Geobacter sp. SVR]
MPTYDYRCQQCGRNFSVTMHIAEHDQQRMTCPDCKGVSIVQQYSTFFARTSKKS